MGWGTRSSRWQASTILVLPLALCLGACGSSSSGGTASRPTSSPGGGNAAAAFHAKANAICGGLSAYNSAHHIPDGDITASSLSAAQLAAVRSYYRTSRALPAYRQLIALTAPTSLTKQWAPFTEQLAEYTNLYMQVRPQLDHGSEAALLRANDKLFTLFKPLDGSLVAAGFATTDPCALYFGSTTAQGA